MGLDLTTDELEGLGNGDDVVDAGRDLEGLDFVPAAAPHGRHNGAFGATGYVRLVPSFADAFDNVIDLLFGSAIRHIDDHAIGPPSARKNQRPRFLRIAA